MRSLAPGLGADLVEELERRLEVRPGVAPSVRATELRVGTRGMDMVWPSLKRGVWLFKVHLRGTDGALKFVKERTFTVTGYQ